MRNLSRNAVSRKKKLHGTTGPWRNNHRSRAKCWGFLEGITTEVKLNIEVFLYDRNQAVEQDRLLIRWPNFWVHKSSSSSSRPNKSQRVLFYPAHSSKSYSHFNTRWAGLDPEDLEVQADQASSALVSERLDKSQKRSFNKVPNKCHGTAKLAPSRVLKSGV